jgi:hypothetical protein
LHNGAISPVERRALEVSRLRPGIHPLLRAGGPPTDPATDLRFAKMQVCAPFIAASLGRDEWDTVPDTVMSGPGADASIPSGAKALLVLLHLLHG